MDLSKYKIQNTNAYFWILNPILFIKFRFDIDNKTDLKKNPKSMLNIRNCLVNNFILVSIEVYLTHSSKCLFV